MSRNSKALTYLLLPQVLPRIGDLFREGFSFIPYMIAAVFVAFRMLPYNHPYLMPENKGRFGILNVMGQAANHLTFDKKNIDKIIIFFAIAAGLVILFMQFLMLVFGFFFLNAAFAFTVAEMFSVTSPFGHGAVRGTVNGVNYANFQHFQDIAFIFMDSVFGTTGIFDSCLAVAGQDCVSFRGAPLTAVAVPGTNTLDYPTPFHEGLHQLFRFYSLCLFIVAVLIILYLVTAIVAETAATGTPFGQRTNKLWAPIRLILFFGLLLPLGGPTGTGNGSFNGAQILTLWSAKLGSNFATNAWGLFNDRPADNTEMIAPANIPTVEDIVQFMVLARTCKLIEDSIVDPVPAGLVAIGGVGVQPFFVDNRDHDNVVPIAAATNIADLSQNLSNNGEIMMVIGSRMSPPPGGLTNTTPNRFNIEQHMRYPGYVRPLCGQMLLPAVTGDMHTGAAANSVAQVYLELVLALWRDNEGGAPRMIPATWCTVTKEFHHGTDCTERINYRFMRDLVSFWQEWVATRLDTEISLVSAAETGSAIGLDLEMRGWAGAGMFYNSVAVRNGQLIDALNDLPHSIRFPMVMEQVRAAHLQSSQHVPIGEQFSPLLPNGIPVDFMRPEFDERAAPLLNSVYKLTTIQETGGGETSGNVSARPAPGGNWLINMVETIFGTTGLYELQTNTQVHPLAQLSSLGKSMLNASIRNLSLGVAGTLVAGQPESVLKVISGALSTFGLMTLTISVILYYILPMMPFIYFFFAVITWIKSLFEAMVGLPLWALAHLRLGGDGLPGRDAAAGYYMILEIFLRPFLIIVGFVASILFFSAMFHVLQFIYSDLINIVTGFDAELSLETIDGQAMADYIRSPIDELFYTGLFAVIIYMTGMASFKLIDQVPKQIMRWIGESISTFQDIQRNNPEELISMVYRGGTLLSSNLRGGRLAALLG